VSVAVIVHRRRFGTRLGMPCRRVRTLAGEPAARPRAAGCVVRRGPPRRDRPRRPPARGAHAGRAVRRRRRARGDTRPASVAGGLAAVRRTPTSCWFTTPPAPHPARTVRRRGGGRPERSPRRRAGPRRRRHGEGGRAGGARVSPNACAPPPTGPGSEPSRPPGFERALLERAHAAAPTGPPRTTPASSRPSARPSGWCPGVPRR
jgi:hypothetical protein